MSGAVFSLKQTMRWYGPSDIVSLGDIRQAGCSEVVSALHHIPVGEPWHSKDIRPYKSTILSSGLDWTVVESLPVHDEIKSRQGDYLRWIENYKESIRNLAEEGIEVITYNFMPVLDWLRTDVSYRMDDNSETLLFSKKDYAVFDLFILNRQAATESYSPEKLSELRQYYESLAADKIESLKRNMLLGLPGSNEHFTREQVLRLVDSFREINDTTLRKNHVLFLNEVAPVAESAGIKLAIHPDDPPFPVLGLPRIMSTLADIDYMMAKVKSPAAGLCFCTGSFGANPENDPVAMIEKWGSRIYFLHLRNTQFLNSEGDFMEASHLDGHTDIYAVMKTLIRLMERERRAIPMRPDHGFRMLDDLNKTTYPGYSAIGRLKGLAELRGLELGIRRSMAENARD